MLADVARVGMPPLWRAHEPVGCYATSDEVGCVEARGMDDVVEPNDKILAGLVARRAVHVDDQKCAAGQTAAVGTEHEGFAGSELCRPYGVCEIAVEGRL